MKHKAQSPEWRMRMGTFHADTVNLHCGNRVARDDAAA
jgi:hypothetical protein